jgi:hypothetical protein
MENPAAIGYHDSTEEKESIQLTRGITGSQGETPTQEEIA